MIAREKAANEIHIRIIIETDTENREALRRVLLIQLDKQRKLIAARFAPSGPERDDERFAAIFRENLVVPGKIDERQIRGRRLCGFRGGFARSCLRERRIQDSGKRK